MYIFVGQSSTGEECPDPGQVAGVVGAASTSVSIQVARALTPLAIPQVRDINMYILFIYYFTNYIRGRLLLISLLLEHGRTLFESRLDILKDIYY